VYITATALAKLANPEGEVALTRAAYNQDVIQMCPTLASCSLDEMISAKKPGQTQWFQLYVNRNKQTTYELVKKAEKGGIKALCITVDAPQLGRREKDMRNKFTDTPPDVQRKDKVQRSQGTARAISQFIDPCLCWDDLKWFRSITNMPIVLKGIQCGEDAVLAVQHGVQAIIVSNHGGRQLDFARSGIEVLAEVMHALRFIGAEHRIEVYVDGGIRRGTDIFKAIALGAKAVGIGRPVLYGLAGYGQDGVERVVELLKDELQNTMQLMGTPTIQHIKPEMVITRNIADHFVPSPKDYLSSDTYVPLSRL
jgi:L-lactate dehydrogenase (cytochrome)